MPLRRSTVYMAFNTRNEDLAVDLITEDVDFVNIRNTGSKGAAPAHIAQSRRARSFDRPARRVARNREPLNAKLKFGTVFAAMFCTWLGVACIARSDQSFPAASPTADISIGLNDFGFRLLSALANGSSGNVIISPYSVSIALAMTYNGAAGDTKAEMGRTLALSGMSDKQINRNYLQMIEAVEKADHSVQMETANALWAQSGFPINPEFVKVTHGFYAAPVESVDFSTDPDRAAEKINDWVNRSTHSKIPTIVKSPDPNTRLILTDAVYFKGRWQRPFIKNATKPRPFHLQGASPADVEVPMMVQNGEYQYFETDTLQAIALLYGNAHFQMYVLLPRSKGGLADLLRSLDESHWREWTNKLSFREGEIVLPKFETTYAKQLNDALINMGMAVAFDARKADFSLIHQPPPGLYVGDVEHKTYVKVDEEGTEAAAATSVGIELAAKVYPPPPPPFKMIVDHPFFFAIGERHTKALLFAGIVTNPTSK
jgi:serine protease inhibitor